MNRFLKAYYERLLTALVAMVVLASLGWFWRARTDLRRIKAISVATHLTKSNYATVLATPFEASSARWSKPNAQPAGDGWLYELFTPPVVFYDQKAAMFSVTPLSEPEETAPAFNIELNAVKRELYRLQLTGYFGEAGAYTAVFIRPGDAGILLSREGKRFDELGLTLRSFSVRRVALEHPDSWPVYEVVALAEMYDEKTKTTVMLDSRAPKFSDTPVATIRISGQNHALQDVREGDTVVAQGCTYKIGSVQDVPATLTVIRESPDGSPLESKILRPVGTDLADAARAVDASKHFPTRRATGIATHDN